MVYEIQKTTISFLKEKLGSLKKIEYFTDGCGAKKLQSFYQPM